VSAALQQDRPGVALSLAHGADIDGLLAPLRAGLGRDCLSDLAFSNLYLFRHAHAYRYLPGPFPCVAGVTYDGVRHLLPLFDLARAPADAAAALLGDGGCFFPVAAATAARLDARLYLSVQCEADADYLYPAENFRSYRGKLLRKKRSLMAQLLDSTAVQAQQLTPDRLPDALDVLARWMQDKGKTPGEADQLACREALMLAERFCLDGTVYYADGEAVGFLLAQRMADDTAVMRFAKGIDARKGIYQYMFHHYCMQAAGLEWLNFEQDMGLPNFRHTKRSYQPAAMLAKHRVSLRG
jgi:hypothetical protein